MITSHHNVKKPQINTNTKKYKKQHTTPKTTKTTPNTKKPKKQQKLFKKNHIFFQYILIMKKETY